MKNMANLFEEYARKFRKTGQPISVNFRTLVPELNKQDRYTHLIHSYPAKLLTNIPYYFLKTEDFCPKNGVVADPFCGTGTVLLEALLSGRNTIGADANPLAELITKVKTRYLPKEKLIRELGDLLKRAKSFRRKVEHSKAVTAWYSYSSLRQLSNLQLAISEIDDKHRKSFFELCFSSAARKVSYADPSISVPVHWNPERFKGNPIRKKEVERKLKALQTVNVYEKFESICKTNIDRLGTLRNKIRKDLRIAVVSNDARQLGLPDNSVDLILTSPPYAGAQKYIRASWLNLYWLKLSKLEDMRELKAHNIGREDYRQGEISESYTGIVAADRVLKRLYSAGYKKRAFLAANYLNEMKVAFDESFRVLKTGGYMVIVIGNNIVCKRRFNTQDYITTYLEELGMKLQFKLIDDIKSYGLMTKRNKTASTITSEWVLVLKK